MPKYKNAFTSPDFVEETITDGNGNIVGTIRIKPSGVLWKPKGKQKFLSVPLETFKHWITDPATKATEGHDENIDEKQAAALCGEERYREAKEASLELYRFASEHAEERGIILADTKFELGVAPGGTLVLGDEALTPDSSRFWPVDGYESGAAQPSFDKQFVRDWCEETGWDKTPPGPELPDDVVAGTRARYVEAFERLTGISFDRYVADPEVVL